MKENLISRTQYFFSNNSTLRKILKLPHGYEVDKEKFVPF